MKPITIFGFKCSKKDEKILTRRINDYLATLNRTMSKAKNKSMLEARLPFVLKHFYWNLNKGVGTWFEIFPNEDVNGNYYNKEHKECGWIMITRINLTHPMYDNDTTEGFLKKVIESTQFEYTIIDEKEHDDQ